MFHLYHWPRFAVLFAFVVSGVFVHFRGRVRHKVRRQLLDHAAMFALLPPGARLGAHRDPFAGSLRYHLGLSTPNSERCRIFVDGQLYYWKDGEPVIFDETYIHRAENQTNVQRIILFCDIERPLSNRFARALNRFIGRPLARAAATQNVDGEKIGFLNKVFGYAYQIRVLGKRIKNWNKPAYYVAKWALIGSLLYAIFLRGLLTIP